VKNFYSVFNFVLCSLRIMIEISKVPQRGDEIITKAKRTPIALNHRIFKLVTATIGVYEYILKIHFRLRKILRTFITFRCIALYKPFNIFFPIVAPPHGICKYCGTLKKRCNIYVYING